MGTAAALIAEARKHVGMKESSSGNAVQKWYNAHVENLGAWNWSWCDAFVTYCASNSGNLAAVCPAGGRAYTVSHAQDFQKRGQWHTGTKANVDKALPGDIVFFDWGGSDSIGAIDHVGIVIKRLGGGRVQTIEGNTSNTCATRERSYVDIAGYGRPKYTAGSATAEGDDDVSAKDVWKADGLIASPPWIAEKGNKFWTGESYLVWLYRNQAKQTEQLNALQAMIKAQGIAIDALSKAVAAGRTDLDPAQLAAEIKAEIAKIEVRVSLDEAE